MSDRQQLVNQVFLEIDGMGRERVVELLADLVSLTVESSLHLPDSATLVVHDTKLAWIDDAALEPGKALKISATTGAGEHRIFDGEIVGLEPAFAPHAQRCVIRAFDRIHRLSRGRKVRSFLNVTDGDVFTKLAQECGLKVKCGATNKVHKYLFQNNETNLEFIRTRAATLGYVAYVHEKVLVVDVPKADGATVELEWAKNLKEFHPTLTTMDQISGATARGWDPEHRQEVVGRATEGVGRPEIGQSQAGGALAKKAFGIDAGTLAAYSPIRDQAQADMLAKAVAAAHTSRFVEAEGTCAGQPEIVAGTPLKIKGVGDRFSGTYLVTSCRHEYGQDKTFTTSFSVSGRNPSNLLSLLKNPAPPAPHRGLVIGIVTDNNDPDKLGRVKVKYPWLAPDQESFWARVVTVGGGPDRGVGFLPEINDEVLVGFEQDDIQYAYVLGGLWNGKDAPPEGVTKAPAGGKVQKRVIRTRVGHQITFDDTDGGGGIEIVDKSKNSVKIDTGSNSLMIEVKGDVAIDAKGTIKLKATGPVEISGMKTTVEGKSMVEIKGGMINLN
jgi:phage protein D